MALIRDDLLGRTMEDIDRQRSIRRSEDERRRREEEGRAAQTEEENERKRRKEKTLRRQGAKVALDQAKTNALRFLHPSVALSRRYTGDRDLSTLYRGESDKLLYQLKNLMQFRQLGQLKMTRLFTDGTVITAWSIFGQDFVNIDVSQRIPIPILEEITIIDCCQKDSTERGVVVLAERGVVGSWKVGCAERGDCESYGECEGIWNWCPVPLELPFDSLLEETSFRARPEESEEETKPPGDGSCPPYRWGFSGLGSIEPSGDFDESIIYTPPVEGNCKDDITITVKDRCETLYQTHRPPCCDEALELEIEYTSLTMACSASQTLTAKNGCAPYSWDLTSGGGTLTPAEDTLTALYTAPATNPNCVNNPTITLTDCCGVTTDLKLTVNCDTGVSGYIIRWELNFIDGCALGDPNLKRYWFKIYSRPFYCDGTEGAETELSGWTYQALCNDPNPPKSSTDYKCVEKISGPIGPCGMCPTAWSCKYHSYGDTLWDGAHDTRSDEQKSQGCCPPQLYL